MSANDNVVMLYLRNALKMSAGAFLVLAQRLTSHNEVYPANTVV